MRKCEAFSLTVRPAVFVIGSNFCMLQESYCMSRFTYLSGDGHKDIEAFVQNEKYNKK